MSTRRAESNYRVFPSFDDYQKQSPNQGVQRDAVQAPGR